MCGGVRWQLSDQPLGAGCCHCKRCQRRTGTAFSLTVLTAPGSFELTEGEDALTAPGRPATAGPSTSAASAARR